MIPKARWFVPIVLTILLGFGAFLRFESLNKQSYWMDEGYTVNAVISQEQNGTRGFGAILDSGKTYFCPLYCYPTLVLKQWFGNEPATYRAVSALFGTLFIIVVYLVAKEFFQRQSIALLAAFFTTFSYWQIAWSRQARWYTELEVFFWLALICFQLFLRGTTKRQQIVRLGLSGVFTILAIATQSIAYLLPPIMLSWFLYEKRPTKKQFLLSFAVTAGFLVFAELGLQLQFIIPLFKQLRFNNHFFYYGSFYFRNYWPLLFLSLYGFIRANVEQRKSYLFLTSSALLYIVAVSTLNDIIHYRYLFHLTPVFYILSAAAIVDILAKISHRYLKITLSVVVIILYFVSSLGALLPKDFYSLEADDPATLQRTYYAYTPQPDFSQAYRVIEERLKSDEIVISTHPQFNKIFLGQPGYWLAYDYLGRADIDKVTDEGKDHYVNAEVIHSLAQLQWLMETRHGYVIYDYMSIDGRLSEEIITYIQQHSGRIFYDQNHSYSQIWVYQF